MEEVQSQAQSFDGAVDYSRHPIPLAKAFWRNFLGDAKNWFKLSVIFSIVLNTILRFTAGKEVTAIALLVEFIFMLVMSLQCYPLQSGGLLVLHAIALGLTKPEKVLKEIEINLNVFLLLIFMVSCIFFLRNVLLFIFTQMLLNIQGKRLLSVVFVLTAAVMSAFLDALTVSAVVVSVCTGLLGVYYHVVKHRRLPQIYYERRNSVSYELYPKIRRKPTKEKLTKRQVERLLEDGVDPRKELYPGRGRKSREDSLISEYEDFFQQESAKYDARHGSGRTSLDIRRGGGSGILNVRHGGGSGALNVRHGGGSGAVSNRSGESGAQTRPPVPGPLETFKMPSLKVVFGDKIEKPKVIKEGEEMTAEHERVEYEMGRFRAFLRSLLMHAAVGTALGGLVTKVGEPQNLIVADKVGWDFTTFVVQMMPVWAICLPVGVSVTVILESMHHFGYGTRMPAPCREILKDFAASEYGKMETAEFANLTIQVLGSVILITGLVLQVAEVGLVGLMVIILITSFNGVIIEHEIAEAFQDAMPFVSLIVVFFGVVAVLDDNKVFEPVIDAVLALEEDSQPGVMFIANGILSMVSDNVFVATLFIDQIATAFEVENSTLTREQYDRLAISVLAGTNIPSMATPNGQAAFLFILTSNLAPIVQLSYRKMTLMAAPYTLVLTFVGIMAVIFLT